MKVFRSAVEGSGSGTEGSGSSAGTTPATTETKKPVKGLQIRKFEGAITDPEKKGTDGKNLVLFKYNYPRVVLPWSRTGKDIEGNNPEGAVPSMAEIMAAMQASGFTTEFVLDKENNPEGPSIAGMLIEGWNNYENRLARTKAENTPDSAKEKALQMFMSKTGMNRADAEKFLSAAFAQPTA